MRHTSPWALARQGLPCRYFQFETVILSHYASFPMVAGDANEFVGALAGHDSKALVPRPGTAVEL